jgi:hypothetical protein
MAKSFDTTSTLLYLIQEVAYSDGSMSPREESLIAELIELHQLEEDRGSLVDRLIDNYGDQSEYRSAARGGNRRISRAELLVRLENFEQQADRELAVSLAYLTIHVDQNPEDHFSMNAAEQCFYAEVVKASGLRAATIIRLQEEAGDILCQWSRPSLVSVIKRLFV